LCLLNEKNYINECDKQNINYLVSKTKPSLNKNKLKNNTKKKFEKLTTIVKAKSERKSNKRKCNSLSSYNQIIDLKRGKIYLISR
jgi:hypothetical protein